MPPGPPLRAPRGNYFTEIVAQSDSAPKMFAFGGATIVQKFTWVKCKHFWQFLAQCQLIWRHGLLHRLTSQAAEHVSPLGIGLAVETLPVGKSPGQQGHLRAVLLLFCA